MTFPLDKQTVDQVCTDFGLHNAKEFGNVSIRQLVGVVKEVERRTGVEYIHMEIGEPGLPADAIAIEAEHEALLKGCATKYPAIDGIPAVKHWGHEFIKAFVGLDIPESCIIPTVGSMQGAFAINTIFSQLDKKRDTVLFLDPCFPVHKLQCAVIGTKVDAIDFSFCRGAALEQELEKHLASGRVSSILFSNPNNPSWMCLTEDELAILGRVATKHDVLLIEDLAYLNMDFRDTQRGTPYQSPYQPSVGRYTDNCVHLVSSSKIFSYAGQRAAIVAINPKLAQCCYPNLAERYNNDGQFIRNFIYVIITTLSTGVAHSVQHGLAAMFKAACEGKIDYIGNTKEYARRTKKIRDIVLRNGFHIVYDKDADNQQVGDGFFFTFGYKNWTGEQLINKLIYYGVATISLGSTGAQREGVRGCSSTIRDDQYGELDKRLAKFNQDYGN